MPSIEEVKVAVYPANAVLMKTKLRREKSA